MAETTAETAAEAPQEQQEQKPQAVRHGSRWLNRHPTEQQVRDWFKSQPLHRELMDQAGEDESAHDPYMGGIVVIGSKDKPLLTKYKENGDPFTVEVEVAVFTPYVKVDTRIAYFWDLVRAMNVKANDDRFVGAIEPVPQTIIKNDRSPYYNEHLPEGFSALTIRNGDSESFNRYFVATFEAAIYERESYARKLNGSRELPVLKGRGTKQVPASKRYADDNALMKTETGAIGRALGVAGILVVGTGVATAEDMQESNSNAAAPAGAGAGPEQAAVPAVVNHGEADTMAVPAGETAPVSEVAAGPAVPEEQDQEAKDAELRTRALALQKEMEQQFPDVWAAYKEWWAGRNFGPLSDLNGPALNGAVIKLERDLDAARTAAAGAA